MQGAVVYLLIPTDVSTLWYPDEASFIDPTNKKNTSQPFPKISDPAEVEVTLVAPAYNETERLPNIFN